MKTCKLIAALLAAMLLGGCLEVKQFPPWIRGQYAGKPDNRSFQVKFHNDRLAWVSAILNRNLHQNEYNRANP